MKKQRSVLSIMTIVAAIFIAQSCVEDTVSPKNKNLPSTVQDLKVPETFNWETSKTVTCKVNATNQTRIAIYSAKNSEDDLLAELTAIGSSEIHLSLPIAVTKLYLKYTSVAGVNQTLEQAIKDNVAVFNITDGAQKMELQGAKVATKAMPIAEQVGYMIYPAGWGSVLFEDLFPGVGDYDFNDFVASYLIMLEYPWEDGAYDTKHTKNIRVQMRLRAIGGSLQFTPYVRIVGLDKNIVSIPEFAYNNPLYVNPKITNDTRDGVKVNLANSTITNDAIIEFQNLNATNPYQLPGSTYYNTTPGQTTKFSQITEVTVYLQLSQEVEIAKLLDDRIDIFIASANKAKEIHLRGFNPVFSSYNYSDDGVSKAVPYATPGNLVWGIKVPKGNGFAHAAEQVNFCSAYKDFSAWVTTGGATNANWYETNVVEENLIRLRK